MPTKSEAFMQEFVLSFGFLGGLFIYVGVDPEEELVRALLKIVIPSNDSLISLILIVIGLIATIAGIVGTNAAAGKGGLIIVGVAWIAGLIIAIGGNWSVAGAFLLIGAFIAGPIAYDYHNN
jgi:hypothetical protein